ncbi:MAG: D-TA family PLP-dependent enzyme [Pseudomonadota bacterium]
MIFPTLETPAVLVDLDVAEANIDRFQAYCDKHHLALRPHIKTHKLAFLAHRQLAAGAVGVTCQKVSEAEAMVADGGIEDVLITYNIIGEDKLKRLRALAQRVKLSVVADNELTIQGLTAAFATAPEPLRVLVECDTGAGRCGVQTPEAADNLAQLINEAPGLSFGGLMTYPPVGREADVEAWLRVAKQQIEAGGTPVPVISNGGSPGMWRAHEVPVATEYRIGTYVYFDRSLVTHGTCKLDDCALTVLASVVSVPTEGRAVIDAGSKVLTSDLLGLEGYGHVIGRPDVTIASLSEEHGVLHAENIAMKVGDRLRVVPNHACVVSNMMDEVQLVRNGKLQGPTPVTARGTVQ